MNINKKTKQAFWELYDEIYHTGMLEYESITESCIMNAIGDNILTAEEAQKFQEILDLAQCIYEERFYDNKGEDDGR